MVGLGSQGEPGDVAETSERLRLSVSGHNAEARVTSPCPPWVG